MPYRKNSCKIKKNTTLYLVIVLILMVQLCFSDMSMRGMRMKKSETNSVIAVCRLSEYQLSLRPPLISFWYNLWLLYPPCLFNKAETFVTIFFFYDNLFRLVYQETEQTTEIQEAWGCRKVTIVLGFRDWKLILDLCLVSIKILRNSRYNGTSTTVQSR